jgi:hypothetical protein
MLKQSWFQHKTRNTDRFDALYRLLPGEHASAKTRDLCYMGQDRAGEMLTNDSLANLWSLLSSMAVCSDNTILWLPLSFSVSPGFSLGTGSIITCLDITVCTRWVWKPSPASW